MKEHDRTARRKLFVLEYLKDHNGTQAAIRAGYAPKTAAPAASRLLRNVKVSAEIQKGMDERAKRLELDSDKVIQEIARLAFSNMWDYIEIQPDGSVKFDLLTLNEGTAAGIAKFHVDEFMDGSGKNARPVKRIRLVLADKLRALGLLGKHMGLFH